MAHVRLKIERFIHKVPRVALAIRGTLHTKKLVVINFIPSLVNFYFITTIYILIITRQKNAITNYGELGIFLRFHLERSENAAAHFIHQRFI